MKEFIEYIVKNLVDKPDLVAIACHETDTGVVVEVRVDAQDVGKVIGRKGLTIKALRTIATTACARLGHRVSVEVIG
jgi:uncharacterized protein